jgi:hypothetical protein
LACVGLATFIAVVALRALEIAGGGPPLPSPKAQHGLFVVAAVIVLLVVPYVIGARAARLLWRSRIRFVRNYQRR